VLNPNMGYQGVKRAPRIGNLTQPYSRCGDIITGISILKILKVIFV